MPKAKLPRRQTGPEVEAKTTSDEGRSTVIMFVDIMGASEVSNHKTLQDYFYFVNRFQEMFRTVCEQSIKDWFEDDDHQWVKHEERGDEGVLMIFRPTTAAGLSEDVDAAVNIAFELKRRWICEQENANRISGAGLLPINLAVGIHVGRTYLEKDSHGRWSPEGYAINLAKRVESYSRLGKSTHIFLSEAAHGCLSVLPDERLYLFENAQVFSPKGISRDITVYEVKHHFLPTDWKEKSGTASSRRSKAFLNPESVDLGVLERALSINPTNIWLIEEFIRSSMLQEYTGWVKSGKKANEEPSYKSAWDEAGRLAQSDQRDAGGLFIQGLIEGERGDSEAERERYADAINHTDQLAEAYWYTALSYSYQVFDTLDGDIQITFDNLDAQLQEWVTKAKTNFEKARLRRTNSAWIPFDYGCELIRWAKDDNELNLGIDYVQNAVSRLPEVRSEIKDQPYLSAVINNDRIKALMA